MEISGIGSCNLVMGRTDLACREINDLFSASNSCKISRNRVLCFGQGGVRSRGPAGAGLSVKAVRSVEPVVSDKGSCSAPKPKSHERVKLFVGLPFDAVSECGTVKHARAIAAGLRALKLLGVDGVELPIWWGLVEKEAMGKYHWSGYLSLAEMVQKAGLELHVSLSFHACEESKISLPDWVSSIGESDQDIFFTDKSGRRYKNCLSFGVDDVPALNGKTGLQVYKAFCESFKSAFGAFMGSTITGISMGLGPNGELRYPSHHHRSPKNSKTKGIGEFQCYDKNMLALLKQHSESFGTPSWGLGGPHDTPAPDQAPSLFFHDHGGSWETPYGDFFLSWYSNHLISHGNSMLSLASSTFLDQQVTVSGKLPLIHSWYKTRAHASELTAGFYNTVSRNGYEAIASTFAKNSCRMILPGMDLTDKNQPQDTLSSPELLLEQIRGACGANGVEVSGENSSAVGVSGGFERIKENLSGHNVVKLFTYQRMGAYFFSPEHFPMFTEFVRSLKQRELDSDDLPSEEDGASLSVHATKESDSKMQVA